MRILIISDIHANLDALERVVEDAGDFDETWCLGDIVGYGPNPNECVTRIQQLPQLTCILGNHDAAVLEQIDIDTFNQEAQHVILWTQETLAQSSRTFLQRLPERVIKDQVTLVHGSPRQPVWEYLLDTHAATRNFAYFNTPFCFVGHTHLPTLYYLDGNSQNASISVLHANDLRTLAPRTIINPGSVGQPRDRDPRAGYAIFDPTKSTWEHRRVDYNIAKVQDRMREAGLPERHIQRLSTGW